VRIGVDVGGTKIEAVALQGSQEIARRRIETPRGHYDATVEAIGALVEGLEQVTNERGTVGVGIPGTISPATGLVKNANSVWLIGRPLGADLQQRLSREVRIANDANCFAVSEASDGAGAGADVVFGAIVGTGTGAGLVVHGQLVTGCNAIAGEWGHNPLPWPTEDERPGPRCYCGRWGCIETFLSGPALEAEFGHGKSARQIAALAAVEDDALRALERYEGRMARALASIINVLDPDVIVLGGGLSNVERLYRRVPLLWGPFVFSDTVATRLVRARHGDSSGVRGAAWLWPE
jgi:fructokinase